MDAIVVVFPNSNNLLWNRLLLFFFTNLIPQTQKRDGFVFLLISGINQYGENKQRPPLSLSLDPQRKLAKRHFYFYFFPIILPPYFLGGRGSSILNIPDVGLSFGPAQLPAFHKARLTVRFTGTFKVIDSIFEKLLPILKIFYTTEFQIFLKL